MPADLNIDIMKARGTSHDDWVNSQSSWKNDDREMSRASVILREVDHLDEKGKVKRNKERKKMPPRGRVQTVKDMEQIRLRQRQGKY